MREINQIVIHCSATRHTDDNIDRDEIRRMHVEGNGWSDIGYHWVIRRDGTVQKGRPLARSGAHAKGYNTYSIGICLIGGLADNGLPTEGIHHFTIEQQLSLAFLVNETRKHFNITSVVGHRELPDVKKLCPTFHVPLWLDTIPLMVAKMEFAEYHPVMEE